MSWHNTSILALALTLFSALPARALCIYKGQLYAKTTVSQEWSDAKWVVRAKLVSAENHSSDHDDSWTVYHLTVLTAFKGRPPSPLALFTYRNSGGFYLDKGMHPDLGGEYLLFLDPSDQESNFPADVRSATEVNYNCGQSKAWRSVSLEERKHLAQLARTRKSGDAQ